MDFILELAKRFDIPLKFQPVNTFLACSKDVSSFLCPEQEYKSVIEKLIKMKKRGSNNIINSVSGLSYLLERTVPSGFNCCAGLLYFRITPAGDIYRCSSTMEQVYSLKTRGESLKLAILKISPKTCGHCLCTATLELNLMYSLKPDALRGLVKHI